MLRTALFDAPLAGFGAVDDKLFSQFKESGVIDPWHMSAEEWQFTPVGYFEMKAVGKRFFVYDLPGRAAFISSSNSCKKFTMKWCRLSAILFAVSVFISSFNRSSLSWKC